MFVERSTQYTSFSSRKQPANAGTERKQFTENASVALQQPILTHANTKCPPVGETSSRKWWCQQPHCLTLFTDKPSNWLGLLNILITIHIILRLLTITLESYHTKLGKWTYWWTQRKLTTINWLESRLKFFTTCRLKKLYNCDQRWIEML